MTDHKPAALTDVASAMPVVIGYGMGVDSTALLVEWGRRGLPRPAVILTADTGDEKPETYRYQAEVVPLIAERFGLPAVTMVKRTSPRAGDASLSGECLRKSVLPSLAYGGHSCSLKWKVEPQWAWCRDHFKWTQARRKRASDPLPAGTWAHGPSILKLIGYDASPADCRRINNAVGKWPPGHLYRYPLNEWRMTRRACIDSIVQEQLPGFDPQYLRADLVSFTQLVWIERGGIPMKSACWMCPASKKPEIDWLSRFHPELADKARLMETKAHQRGLRTIAGLGRSYSWTDHLNPAMPPLLAAMEGCNNP